MPKAKVFISHDSALEFWRHHDLGPSGGIKRTRATSLRQSCSSLSSIKPLVRTAMPNSGRIFGARSEDTLSACLADLSISELPLHVMVDQQAKRQAKGDVVTHYYQNPLPEGSFCRISADVYVASPELTLCQMADVLNPVDTLELCLEFCSGYALNPGSERGFDDRPALTTAKRLASYVEKFKGHRGAKKIRPLLRYVIDNSASPMETIVLMLLCLPSKLGGRQLRLPRHNADVPIKKHIHSHGTRKRLSCDLYWEEYHLDVECDSTSNHSSKRQLGKDSSRRIILEAMRYTHIGITYWQLENPGEFEDVVRAIRRAMGLENRTVPQHVQDNREALRTYLISPRDNRKPLVLRSGKGKCK